MTRLLELYGLPLVGRNDQTVLVKGKVEGYFDAKALIEILNFRLIGHIYKWYFSDKGKARTFVRAMIAPNIQL